MRLLRSMLNESTNELDISLEEFSSDVPPYAILSHQWGRTRDEVSYQDFMGPHTAAKAKKGYRKIDYCCRQALKDGYEYSWVDTCCIDKTSSAELSEAINSMYAWYQQAQVCYAYLTDVPSHDDTVDVSSRFQSSDWFTRGWTLQELIAPRRMTFFTADWIEVGSKEQLAGAIQERTNVPAQLLSGDPSALLRNASVAQKMSWAAGRRTTRIEDRAYSLMGIFGVNIPIIYGEGLSAFRRLQEEIIRSSADHTIFVWQSDQYFSGLLAESPDGFVACSEYRPLEYTKYVDLYGIRDPKPDYTVTNFGLQIQLPHCRLNEPSHCVVAFLACTWGEGRQLTWIYLAPHPGRPAGHYVRAKRGKRSIGVGTNLRQPLGGHNYPRKSDNKLWVSDPDSSSFELGPLPALEPLIAQDRLTYEMVLRVPYGIRHYRRELALQEEGKDLYMQCRDGSFLVLGITGSNHQGRWIKEAERHFFVVGFDQGEPWVDLFETDERSWEVVCNAYVPKPGRRVASTYAVHPHRTLELYLGLNEDVWYRSKPEDFLDFGFSFYIKNHELPLTGNYGDFVSFHLTSLTDVRPNNSSI